MCELTHSADRELQALALLFKTGVKQSVPGGGKAAVTVCAHLCSDKLH